MLLKNNYKNRNEPLLEPVLRELRFGVSIPYISELLSDCSMILDYGCGPKAKFFYFLIDKSICFKKYFGFDPLIKIKSKKQNICLSSRWNDFSKNQYDIVTMFAVIEHLPYPEFCYENIINLIKPGGYLLITTPTKISKHVLEFLSFRLKIVSTREIMEHKHYFSFNEMINMFDKYSLSVEAKKIFEFGMNNFVLFKKNNAINI